MGNSIKKRSNKKNDEKLEYNDEAPNYSSQFSLSSFTSNRFNLSFRGSQRAYSQTSRSRVSRRKFNEVTLVDPLNLSKTCWPVPYVESIFLPHFIINHVDIHVRFKFINNLARGAFGKVYHIVELTSKKDFALKVISKSQIIINGTLQQIKDEVDIQSICGHHPFIVECFEFWQNRKEIFLLSEYIPCGELFDKIKEFPYQLIQLYVAEIAIAIEFLHNAGVIYRDLKPENILLDSRFHIKITDFGLSKWLKFGNRTYTICGTLQYMASVRCAKITYNMHTQFVTSGLKGLVRDAVSAVYGCYAIVNLIYYFISAPEVLLGVGYSHSADWWSLGVVACRMITSKYPTIVEKSSLHESQMENTKLDKSSSIIQSNELNTKDVDLLKNKIVKLPNNLIDMDPAYKDLLNRLLEINPMHRLKSILGLERIAFYKNFSFDAARQKKNDPINFIKFDRAEENHITIPATVAEFE